MKNATRLSFWLDNEQRAWIEERIKKRRFAHISHAIRYALQKLMEEDDQIKREQR